jgi:hypothetical protein
MKVIEFTECVHCAKRFDCYTDTVNKGDNATCAICGGTTCSHAAVHIPYNWARAYTSDVVCRKCWDNPAKEKYVKLNLELSKVMVEWK